MDYIGQIREIKRQQARRGRMIVYTVAALNLIFAVISAFYRFNILALAVQLALSAALALGVGWVRWLFAADAVADAAVIFYVMFAKTDFFALPWYGMLCVAALIAFYLAAGVTLFFSKSVSEFLYEKRFG